MRNIEAEAQIREFVARNYKEEPRFVEEEAGEESAP
jgi:hypothetical protein